MKKFIIAALVGAFLFWLLGLIAPYAWWVLAILCALGGLRYSIAAAVFFGILGLLLGGVITLFGEGIIYLFGNTGLPIIGALSGLALMALFKRFF